MSVANLYFFGGIRIGSSNFGIALFYKHYRLHSYPGHIQIGCVWHIHIIVDQQGDAKLLNHYNSLIN